MLQRIALSRSALLTTQCMRSFRPESKPGIASIYKHNPTPMTAEQKREQEDLPVWDRVFDHQKYMVNKGPLKVSSKVNN